MLHSELLASTTLTQVRVLLLGRWTYTLHHSLLYVGLCIEMVVFAFHFRSLWNCRSSFIQFACNLHTVLLIQFLFFCVCLILVLVNKLLSFSF